MRGLLVVLLLSGCTVYMPRNIGEEIKMVRQAGGTGCILIKANSRPYADVQMTAVSTIGKDSDYLECVKALQTP